MQDAILVQENRTIAYQQCVGARHASVAPHDLACADVEADVGYASKIPVRSVYVIADSHYVAVMYAQLAVKPEFLYGGRAVRAGQLQRPASAIISAAEKQQIAGTPDQCGSDVAASIFVRMAPQNMAVFGIKTSDGFLEDASHLLLSIHIDQYGRGL